MSYCPQCAKLERESDFYRKQLQAIASRKRHTIEQRLAASALTFWDELKKERRVEMTTPNDNKGRTQPTTHDAPAVIPLEHLRMAYDRLVAALEDDGLAEKIADRQIGAWDNAINAYRAAVRERVKNKE